MKSEKNLFELIKNSDEKAFEMLFRLYYKPLVAFCSKYINDKDLAKGLTQQVFVNIWENRENLKTQSPASYLYQSVKNKCFNHLRHQKVRQEYQIEIEHSGSLDKITFDEPSDNIVQIYNSIDKLPSQCKNIFIMSRMHGLAHKEIAEELGIAVKTVKNQIGKALKQLKKELSHLNIGLIICILELFCK